MRHADAGTVRENPMLDTKRGLIKEGKDQCILMARVLGALKAPIDVIVSSPLKRARQTAQLVGTELGYDAQVEVSPALGLNASYADFQDLLAKYADREGILVVGHNPNVFQFLGRMITGNGGAAIRMRKGSIARIDMEQPSAAVAVAARSALGPRHLRQRNEKLAPKDLAEVACFLAQRPKFQLRARASRAATPDRHAWGRFAFRRGERRRRGPGSMPRPNAATPRRGAHFCAPRRGCYAGRDRRAAGGSCPCSARWPRPAYAAVACSRKSPSWRRCTACAGDGPGG